MYRQQCNLYKFSCVSEISSECSTRSNTTGLAIRLSLIHTDCTDTYMYLQNIMHVIIITLNAWKNKEWRTALYILRIGFTDVGKIMDGTVLSTTLLRRHFTQIGASTGGSGRNLRPKMAQWRIPPHDFTISSASKRIFCVLNVPKCVSGRGSANPEPRWERL